MMKCVVICPTYNAGELWNEWIISLKKQNTTGLELNVTIIDSSSSDSTVQLSNDAGFETLVIPTDEFNHAGTRNRAAKHVISKYKPDILVFITQDAVLSSEYSIKSIVQPLQEKKITAVCGRQLPHHWADPIAQHSRIRNYSGHSHENSKIDIEARGLKTAYMSNSFAAYRSSVYFELGGFPEGLIFGEDMFLSAKMILEGYKTYYSADALVRHSHNYSLREEFKRYFDIGVFHSSQPFLLENFGKPSGEGLKFAISELKYSLKEGGVVWAINSIVRTGLKFIGYKLGRQYKKLPNAMRKTLSMDKNYWFVKWEK